MNTTWLIICNATTAYVYDISKKTSNHLIETLNHPEGRMKGSDLVSDGPGHFKSDISGKGAYIPDDSPHQAELIHFATQIAHLLESKGAKNHFDHLIIAAEPRFYGILEQHFSKHIKSLIKHAIKKDFVPLPAADLARAVENIQHEYF